MFNNFLGAIKVKEDPNKNQEMMELFQLGLSTLFLTLFSIMIPTLVIIAPIPLGVLTYKRGMATGMLTALIASVLMWIIHPILAGGVLLLLGVGIVIGGGYKEKIKPTALFALAVIVAVIALGGVLYLTDFSAYRDKLLEIANDERIDDALAEDLNDIFQLIVYALPAGLLITATLLAYINIFGIHKVLILYKEETDWLKPFIYWRFPWWVAVGFLLSFITIYQLPAETIIHRILYNIMVLLFALLVVQGSSVVTFQVLRWRMHWAFLIIAGIIVFITPYGLMAPFLIGLIDSGFNLRGLPNRNT